MWLSPACYGHMTHQLRSLADGKLVVVLEVSLSLDPIAEGDSRLLLKMLGSLLP